MVVPGRVEVVVHGNSVDLRPQLGDAPLDGIRSWRLLDMGAVWLFTLTMREPGTSISLGREGDVWTSSVVAARPTPLQRDGACDATPRTPLVPLRGREMLRDVRPELVMPAMPRWTDAEVGDPTWEHVAVLRAKLDPADAAAHYALGALHRDLGHSREAAYYFSVAARLGAPGATAVLQRASAQLALGEWAAAGTSAVEARGLGGDAEVVAEIQGIVALMTPGIDPVTAGRTLALTSGRASSSLVAGELLLRGGCADEAASVLQRAVGNRDEGVAMMALRLVVDARILLGDVPGADAALADLANRGPPAVWLPLLRSRSSLLNLLKQSPDAWALMVPVLERLGRGGGDEAYESLFLLGQISETLADTRLAIYAWTTLVDRDRRFLEGEPGVRLTRDWRVRVEDLLAAGRDMDALAMNDGVWRPGLVAHLDDPKPLYDLAAAAERLSMYEPALDLMRTAAEVEGRRGLDDRASILTIARLYRLSGSTPEAEQSLELLATRPPDPAVAAGMTLLRAAIQEDLGNDLGAWALYTTVMGPPPQAAEAALRRAMIDAHSGRCAEALVGFSKRPDPLPASVSLTEVQEDEARCLVATGHPDDARVIAAQAAKVLVDPDALGFLAWTAGTPSVPGDIWSRLRTEDEAQAGFDARVAASRSKKASSPPASDR